jgi:U3 small nucleolar RNA-associated protein 5
VCEHAVHPGESITSLDWGYHGNAQQQHSHAKKKRKRSSSGVNGVVVAYDNSAASDVVVAFGTSTSEIRMYSPAEDKVIGCLSGGHERGIKDFKFTAQKHGQEGWSIGGDGKLIQWDLPKGRSIRYAPENEI